VREQDRRAALRGTAILRLSSDPKLRDLAKSQSLLKELTAPAPAGQTDSRAYEVPYLLALVEGFNNAQAEAAKRAAELGQAASASAVLSRSLDDTRKQAIDAGLSVEQSRSEIERLRAQEQMLRREVQALQAERSALETNLAGARVEIERKDMALRKVAATLAGLRRSP
jgi:chromosome segregation ATPase